MLLSVAKRNFPRSTLRSSYRAPLLRTFVQSAVRSGPEYGDAQVEASVFRPLDTFLPRHLGPRQGSETDRLLSTLGYDSLDAFAKDVVPSGIQLPADHVPSAFPPLAESELLRRAEELGAKNKVFKTWIGQGYYGTVVPSVILRNVRLLPFHLAVFSRLVLIEALSIR
jgi:glycine dehydrogenase